MKYTVKFYGRFEDGNSYLICKETGRRLLHSDMLELISLFKADFELDRNSSNTYSLVFENEPDYMEYINYSILAG